MLSKRERHESFSPSLSLLESEATHEEADLGCFFNDVVSDWDS